MAGRLDGKVCVITGAGGGMGREAAIVFTAEGAKVCVADLDVALAEETVSMCSGDAFAFAVDVADERVDPVAEIINSYRGVTHNYVREARPNIWFTMTEPDQQSLDSNLAEIERRIDAEIIRLPMTRLFKIGVKLDV